MVAGNFWLSVVCSANEPHLVSGTETSVQLWLINSDALTERPPALLGIHEKCINVFFYLKSDAQGFMKITWVTIFPESVIVSVWLSTKEAQIFSSSYSSALSGPVHTVHSTPRFVLSLFHSLRWSGQSFSSLTRSKPQPCSKLLKVRKWRCNVIERSGNRIYEGWLWSC